MASTASDPYAGRVPAQVKHALLRNYLEKLVLIIGMSAKRVGHAEICYVDCFAGPWGSDDENLEGTSIAISLNTLAACKAKLATLGVQARIRALYIEKDKAAFGRLSAFLDEGAPDGVEHSCRHGDFVDLRPTILNWCGKDSFTFFFVDPKGWTPIVIDVMRPLLQRPRSEFVINFIYEFINRTASMPEWRVGIRRLLGRDVDLAGLAPAEREEALVNAYRASLKACVPPGRGEYRARTAYVTVLHPQHRRTKYHLVYLTNHPTGIVEFMGISEKVDIVQAKVRAAQHFDAHAQKTGVRDMFAEESVESASEGRSSPDEVDAFWRHYLSSGDRRVDTAAFADILDLTNWLPGELQASLVRLVKLGAVVNLDANAARRRSKPLHFGGSGERLKLVEGKG